MTKFEKGEKVTVLRFLDSNLRKINLWWSIKKITSQHDKLQEKV